MRHAGAVRVAELAKLAGASPRSVRHYDRAGLLSSTRSSNGYREFPLAAVEEVGRIRGLIASGLNLADIATLRPCLTAVGEFDGCDLARDLLAEHIESIQSEILDRQRTLELLQARLAAMPSR